MLQKCITFRKKNFENQLMNLQIRPKGRNFIMVARQETALWAFDAVGLFQTLVLSLFVINFWIFRLMTLEWWILIPNGCFWSQIQLILPFSCRLWTMGRTYLFCTIPLIMKHQGTQILHRNGPMTCNATLQLFCRCMWRLFIRWSAKKRRATFKPPKMTGVDPNRQLAIVETVSTRLYR